MVLIYTENISNRLKYAVHVIFHTVLGIQANITCNKKEFEESDQVKINYSNDEINRAVNICPNSIISETGISEKEINTSMWKSLPTLFPSKGDIPFDIFASVFYLTVRYEEYLSHEKDDHGRYSPENSVAFKNNFLELPIVDLWCKQLAIELDLYEACPSVQQNNFKELHTVDVDSAWIYKNRNKWLQAAIMLKDVIKFRFLRLKERANVIMGFKKDPADIFKYLRKLEEKQNIKFQFFMTTGRYRKFDKGNPIKNKSYRKLIKTLDDMNYIGWHPSYESNCSDKILHKEYFALAQVVRRKVFRSRQHYLKFQLPYTYRKLIKLGIRYEHSMGYSSRSGFRAGIARPYPFYDLFKEKMTHLTIVPFQLMDKTLNTDEKLTPEEALTKIIKYKQQIKSIGGHLSIIWHNTNINAYENQWKDWGNVFEKSIKIET